MHIFLFIFLLFFVACGEEVQPFGQGEGLRVIQEINTKDTLTKDDRKVLKKICGFLSEKDEYFQNKVVNQNKSFEYSSTHKECSEDQSLKDSVSVNVLGSENGISFQHLDGAGKFFSDYQGRNQGLIAPFCDKVLESSKMPRHIVNGDKVTWIYPVGSSENFCPDQFQTICVMVKIADIVESDSDSDSDSDYIVGAGKVREMHYFSIAADSKRYIDGMLVGRTMESTTSCSEGYYFQYSKLLP